LDSHGIPGLRQTVILVSNWQFSDLGIPYIFQHDDPTVVVELCLG
jgi:hypothetical protein